MDTIERITQLLNEKSISAAKMMRDLGFSSGLFSQWKSGKQKPSAEKLSQIAEYLNTSVDFLINGEKDITDKMDREILVLARKSQELPEEDKKKFLEILRGSVNAFFKEGDNK